MIARHADVGAHRQPFELLRIALRPPRASRTTAGRMRSTIDLRFRDCSCARSRSCSSVACTAPQLRVPEHHHQAGAERFGRELDAADLRGRDDVAGHADDEQVAEALIEDDLGRHARIRTAEDDGQRLLACRQQRAAARGSRRRCPAADEAPIALAQRSNAPGAEIMARIYPAKSAQRLRRTPRTACACNGSSGQ